MAKNTKAVKQKEKALNKKQGALRSFTVAAEEVAKANELLDNSIELHKAELTDIAAKIEALIQAEDQINADILDMESEKSTNNLLISNLKQFTGK